MFSIWWGGSPDSGGGVDSMYEGVMELSRKPAVEGGREPRVPCALVGGNWPQLPPPVQFPRTPPSQCQVEKMLLSIC
eukprot:2309687-Amphidinium_carterae.1